LPIPALDGVTIELPVELALPGEAIHQMGRLVPVSRREFVRRLKRLGFEGPFSGGRHEFMLRGDTRLILPNPHRQDIGVQLLVRLLQQANLSTAGRSVCVARVYKIGSTKQRLTRATHTSS